jgi:hypothetical protein
MPHAGGHDKTAKLLCPIHLALDRQVAAGRYLHGPADLGRLIDWHRHCPRSVILPDLEIIASVGLNAKLPPASGV